MIKGFLKNNRKEQKKYIALCGRFFAHFGPFLDI